MNARIQSPAAEQTIQHLPRGTAQALEAVMGTIGNTIHRNFDFHDDDRYATDCGPACSKCKQGNDDTLWLYICQWPYDRVLGTSACCHVVEQFTLTDRERESASLNSESLGKPDILGIKIAHYRYREAKHNPAHVAEHRPESAGDTCCEIAWIDATGAPTPDSNPMVGYVYREAYTYRASHPTFHNVHYPQTPYFRICEAHKSRLSELPHWRFVEKL